MEPNFIPTEKKIQIIDQLSETGITRMEVTSFVHPKAVPQLADAAEIMARIKKKPGVRYEVLIPNLKGMERALQSGVRDITLVVSASETHNQSNMRMSVAESLSDFKQVVRMARENGCTGDRECGDGVRVCLRRVGEASRRLRASWQNIFPWVFTKLPWPIPRVWRIRSPLRIWCKRR